MKTAIEDYENKSGDKLHGVVVVPFFTTIFKEEAKSLAVPNITIKLPNGQTLATSATKGIATGAKSTVSSIVKATATATVKAKVIAVVCGATILAGTSAVGISILAGCNAEKEPTEPSVISSTVQTSTVSSEVSKAIEDNGLKIDKDGNITDKNGKKVEVKDGKVEVKTDDGKTVTVKVDDVKTTVSNKNNSNKGNTEKKEDTKSNTSSKKDNSSKTNTSDNDKKPAKPSNSSSNNQKLASNSGESSSTKTPTEKPKQKVWVVDYKTVHHEGHWEVVGTKEEPVYETRWVNICNNCGKELLDDNQMDEHLFWELETNGAGAYHAEERQVQVGTKTVDVKKWVEPYDEKVESGHYEYR